jgi:superfamily II DNA or RNA helicase
MELNFEWGEPYKKGNMWHRECLIPNEARFNFFNYWKKHNLELKAKGFSVSKRNDNDWYVIETRSKKSSFDSEKDEPKKTEELSLLETIPLKDSSGLRPWQVNAAEKLCAAIKKWGCAIDGSDLGLGKSYTSCAVARELNLNILVVCPKAVMDSWRRVIKNHFKMEHRLTGIINYELLRVGRKDSPIASYVKRRETRRKEFVWKIPKNTLIIWDESQKLKSAKTKNSETCVAALKQGYTMLFCSATNATNPLELKTVGQAIKLFNTNPEYYTWLYEHGVTKGRFGLEFTGGKEHLIKLSKDIFTNRGVRLRRDTIPNFPESQIIAECYNMEEEASKKINKIYTEMESELKKLRNKVKKEKSTSALTAILRARQEIELVKVPLFVEMVEDGLENGMSIVVFCNFTETINALSERLNTKCIVNGDPRYEKFRQQNIDDFQNDKERIILVNIAAGGAGLSLHDITGKYPRLALISPSYSAVLMRQSTGRVWRDSAKSKSIQKIIFVAKTIEEKVCESVNRNLDNMDALNDGDLKYENEIYGNER